VRSGEKILPVLLTAFQITNGLTNPPTNQVMGSQENIFSQFERDGKE
jgi:hypothetical protein